MKKILTIAFCLLIASFVFGISTDFREIQVSPSGISAPFVPIGGMIAVMPSLHANAWQPPATGQIKDGFMRADGNTVPTCPDCVLPQGTTLPNMVAAYPRGNTTSGATGGANTQASNVAVGNHNALSLNNESSHTHSDGSLTARIASVSNVMYLDEQATDAWIAGYSFAATTSGSSASNSSGVEIQGTTGAGSAHTHSFSQDITAHSVTNNTVNNEPAYVEVVWVIRVK